MRFGKLKRQLCKEGEDWRLNSCVNTELTNREKQEDHRLPASSKVPAKSLAKQSLWASAGTKREVLYFLRKHTFPPPASMSWASTQNAGTISGHGNIELRTGKHSPIPSNHVEGRSTEDQCLGNTQLQLDGCSPPETPQNRHARLSEN